MNVLYSDALIIEPMKINKIPEGKEHMFPSLCESGEYFAQLKKDGYCGPITWDRLFNQ